MRPWIFQSPPTTKKVDQAQVARGYSHSCHLQLIKMMLEGQLKDRLATPMNLLSLNCWSVLFPCTFHCSRRGTGVNQG